MKDRVQVWMSRETFEEFKSLLERGGFAIEMAARSFDNEEGIFMDVMASVEEAYNNNANWRGESVKRGH